MWGELYWMFESTPPPTVCDRDYPPPVYLIYISPSSRIDTEFTAVYARSDEHGQGTLIPTLRR
jgi:hypothetical protein